MKITLNQDKKIGKINPLHAVDQPPIGGAYLEYPSKHFHFLTEAGVPYSRLHDVGGYFGDDLKLVEALYDMMEGNAGLETSLEASVESHLVGIKAEESRHAAGKLLLVHN